MSIEIVNIKIEDLKANEYNPRSMNQKEANELMNSVKEFGLIDPLIVNSNAERKNVIIGGHQRFETAKRLGLKEVPIVYVDLPLDRERELNLRLNRNQGEFDWSILANFGEGELLKAGFDRSEIMMKLKNEFDGGAEVEFSEELLEDHQYVVFFFDKELDFNTIVAKFGLTSVKTPDSKGRYTRIGIGRVIDGKKLLSALK